MFRAIRSIAEGRAWYDASTAGRMLEAIGEKQIRGTDFTARELEVAALISEGQSNKEISTALRISEATVKKHVGHLMKKLGLADRLQVGLFLARHPQLLAQ
ncbi:MAG: response regulator transcription factor [Candidatus Eiseniibacteriota bacterium]